MPKKVSNTYPHDLDKRLSLLVEGFEKHAQELADSDITRETLDKMKDDYTNVRYRVIDLRTEVTEAIEARDKLAVSTYRELQKVVNFIKYKFGAENLTLLDFGIKPKRTRARRKAEEEEVPAILAP